MKKRYDRGFTLVEMITTVAILGVVTLIALPSIASFQKNDTMCDMYQLAFESAAKLYIDSAAEDEFGSQANGCVDLSLDFLMNEKKLVEEYDDKDVTCDLTQSFVRVRKINGNFHYSTYLNCKNTSNETICPGDGGAAIPADTCTNETDYSGPSIRFDPPNMTVPAKNKNVDIIISDDYGYAPNLVIRYWWENSSGAKVSSVKTKNFKNKILYTKTPELKTTVSSPSNLNGNYHLVVEPVSVVDTIGNVTSEKVSSGDFIFDNSPPTLTVSAYKRTSTGGKTGGVIATATANAANAVGSMNNYSGNVNGWLNKTNYPDGIYFEATYQDQYSTMKNLIWKWNATNLLTSSSAYNTLGSSSEENILNKTTSNNYLSGEGQRRSIMTVYDKLGHNSSVSIYVNMDRTNPTFTFNCSKDKSSITCTTTASDSLSGIWKYYYRIDGGGWIEDGSSHKFSGLNSGQQYSIDVYVKDRAGNEASSQNKKVTTDVQYFGAYLRSKGGLTANQGGMYRYVGHSPANYVCIASIGDCAANNSKYLYRVIGVASGSNMTGVEENSVKVVRASYTHSYWGGGSWDDSGTKTHVNSDNFGAYESLISNVCWKNGKSGESEVYRKNALQFYQMEQGWGCSTSKKAIIYVSDYVYAAGGGNGQTCIDGSAGSCRNSWMFTNDGGGDPKQYNYEYTLGTNSNFSGNSTVVIRDHSVGPDEAGALWAEWSSTERRTREVFYLKKDTKYFSGNGTLASPYIIG